MTFAYFPGLGSKIEENCRRRRFKKLPVGIVFRIYEGDIVVLAVMRFASQTWILEGSTKGNRVSRYAIMKMTEAFAAYGARL